MRLRPQLNRPSAENSAHRARQTQDGARETENGLESQRSLVLDILFAHRKQFVAQGKNTRDHYSDSQADQEKQAIRRQPERGNADDYCGRQDRYRASGWNFDQDRDRFQFLVPGFKGGGETYSAQNGSPGDLSAGGNALAFEMTAPVALLLFELLAEGQRLVLVRRSDVGTVDFLWPGEQGHVVETAD